ncbi:hypothetical protein FRC10_000977 [Ceratobasidium sp. 414]|nr:hypothetical protein FRC10_000977 [Ceratobasidium sp. 414]
MASSSAPHVAADANTDLCAARRQLANLPKFDDKGKPMSESEWRYEFLIVTHDLLDKQRAAVWADHLQCEGKAYYWFQAQKATKLNTDNWSKLKDLIEVWWPTPSQNPDAFKEHNCIHWNSSVLDVNSMADALSERSNPTRPHHIWATQHLAKGHTCNSTNKDRVYHTLHYALPPFVVALLSKKYHYGANFTELCKDIGEIPARELYEAWQRETTLSHLEMLSLMLPSPQPPALYMPQPWHSPGPAAPLPTPTASHPRSHAKLGPRHNAEMLAWMQQFEGQTLSMLKPYPLLPGTLEQTHLVCVKCGCGEHKAIDCKAQPAHLLPEHEHSMRGAILCDLNKNAQNSRAGMVPGTPSPPTHVCDVQQLDLLEPEDETYYTDFYDLENK